MKCRECEYAKRGYFESVPEAYVCIGVKEPFVIRDYPNAVCTEYKDEVFTMNTAEMWLKAQKDGKVYECVNGDMAYSKTMGMVDKYDFDEEWGLESWQDEGAKGLDCLLGKCEWRAMDNVMTIEEAEQKFGIKITRT